MTQSKPGVNVIAIVVAAVAAGIGAVGGQALVENLMGRGQTAPKVEEALAQTAAELNRSLPMMVDQITRLDSTAALPGKRFIYKYTLIGVDLSDLDKDGFIREKRQQLINAYKTADSMKTFRDNGVVLSYIYQAEDGNVLAEITISPSDF